MWHARVRFVSLWFSQFTRVLADNCLRIFVILQLAQVGTQHQGASWHVVLALFIAPAIVFAPFNGALSNSLPRRWVLVGTATYCLAVVSAGALLGLPWLVIWGFMAIGSVIYYPTRYAVLPAAAEETRWPLTRVNGFVEMGGALAIVLGIVSGFYLTQEGWAALNVETPPDLPAAVALTLALGLVSVLTALPVRFRGDIRRPEAPLAAVRGFFRDVGRIFAVRGARISLLGMAALRGLVAASTGALLAVLLSKHGNSNDLQVVVWDLVWVGLFIGLGAALGSLLAGLQSHPRRSLGLVPVGATGAALGLVWAALTGDTGWGVCVLMGAMVGLANVPLAAAYQGDLPADTCGNGMAVRQMFEYSTMVVLAMLLSALVFLGLPPSGQFWVVASLATLGAVVGWRLLYAPFLELAFELLMVPMYRIRAQGPGLEKIPRLGPLLIVANHSAWFDPLWLGKVMPRRVRPMMTSLFYDLPILRTLMKYVVEAIRVQFSRYRREAPELKEAIAALDQGQCVVIFPEGSLRRDEARPLRQFGQGVWHILQQRPQTPVMVCWIEGGWGSFCSYFKGPPTKNKRLDWRRRIDVVVGKTQVIPGEILEDQRATRTFLMQQCLETRRHLGLAEVQAETVEEEVGEAAG